MKTLLLVALVSAPALATEIGGVTHRNDAHNSVNEADVKRQTDHFPFSRFFKDEDTYSNSLGIGEEKGRKKHSLSLDEAVEKTKDAWKERLSANIDEIDYTLRDIIRSSGSFLNQEKAALIDELISRVNADYVFLLEGVNKLSSEARAHYVTSLLTEGTISMDEAVDIWRMTDEIPVYKDFKEGFQLTEIKAIRPLGVGKLLTDSQSLKFIHQSVTSKSHWLQVRELMRLAIRR